MPAPWPVPLFGHCACGALRYRLDRSPLYVHCCNCQACQRETGSAFALNAMVESDAVTIVPPLGHEKSVEVKSSESKAADDTASDAKAGDTSPVKPRRVLLPTDSGLGQLSVHCPRCLSAVWSHYAGAGPYLAFIKAGTLEKEGKDGKSLDDVLKPDINIYCEFKQPWVIHDKDMNSAEKFYDIPKTWPKESLERLGPVQAKTKGWQERGAKWNETGDEVDDLTKRIEKM